MSERLLRLVLLALFLVVAQAGAQAHAIEHLSELAHHQDGQADPLCSLCLGFGHLGGIAPAPFPAGAADLPPESPTSSPQPAHLSSYRSPYQSRAPPA